MGRRSRSVLLTAVVIAAAALAPGAATASTRSLGVMWTAPPQPPSITPQPPIVDMAVYMHTASVVYDDVTGTVTGIFSLYDPQYWEHNDLGTTSLEINIASDCLHGPRTPGALAGGPAWHGVELILIVSPQADSNGTYDQATGVGRLFGYEGEIDGQGSFDGTNYSVTLQSSYFAHRDFRCAYFAPGTTTDDPIGWDWLDGYAPRPKCRSHRRRHSGHRSACKPPRIPTYL